MLKQRREAVAQVSADFLKAEAAIDQAARRAAACMATMLDQRAAANLPLRTGLKALELMSDVSALLIKARQLSIDVHGELAMLPAEIGIHNYGDVSECPPMADSDASSDVRRLRIVA